jgi:hypothetical protein
MVLCAPCCCCFELLLVARMMLDWAAVAAAGEPVMGQAHREGPKSGRGWSPGPVVGVRPAAGDESSVPAQDRVWGDHQGDPPSGGQSAGSGPRSVPGLPRTSEVGLAVQDRELVSEHEDLDVIVRVGSCEQNHPAHHPAGQQVHQSKPHHGDLARVWPVMNVQVSAMAAFRAPTRSA